MTGITEQQIERVLDTMRKLLTGEMVPGKGTEVTHLGEAFPDSPLCCLAVLPLGTSLKLVALPPHIINEFFVYEPDKGVQ